MKVHFITSRPTIEKHIEELRAVINAIENAGHSLAIDWIERAYRRQTEGTEPKANWTAIYRLNLEAIAKSDVVLAETSYDNFGVGYQIAFAVQQKKPIMLLRHEDVDDDAFVNGVEGGWIIHEKYNSQNLTSKVNKFLEDNDIKSKDMRFNFFIDRKIHNYLRWASLRTGKTKAEILRELVQHEIEEQSREP